ncbi:MAG TPA: helix-turn-helix domain-containing protein [Acidimicrobiales bacterium]|nr:helix-turn-helix domain-containing protein [Acidimicrobiales bacterium]
MELAPVTDVASTPPARIGWHLQRAREAVGLSVDDASASTGLTVATITDLEHGRRLLSVADHDRLATAYGVEGSALIPPRTPVVVDEAARVIRLGEREADLGDEADVLASYLSLVYDVRGAQPGKRIPLRDEDIDALAAVVGDDPDQIEDRLIELMGCTRDEARSLRALLLRRRVIGSAAALVLGVSGVAALAAQLGSGSDAPAPSEPATSAAAPSPAAAPPAGELSRIQDAPVAELGPSAPELSAPAPQAPGPASAPAAPAPAPVASVDGPEPTELAPPTQIERELPPPRFEDEPLPPIDLDPDLGDGTVTGPGPETGVVPIDEVTETDPVDEVPVDEVPEDEVPVDKVPQDLVPPDTVPQDLVPPDTVPQGKGPPDTVPQGKGPEVKGPEVKGA